MTTADEFLEFVATVLGVDRPSLSLDTAYGTIPQWDSVMHLRLVMEIEERYRTDIPLERVPEIRTLGDFLDLVEAERIPLPHS